MNKIYKCNVCGNMVELIHTGGGQLVCCGQPMELLQAKTQDQGQEKHVPVIEKTKTGIKVKVGEIPHPMEESHFIQWIEVTKDKKTYRKYLTPQDKPEAEFALTGENITVREYCNVHGLWKA